MRPRPSLRSAGSEGSYYTATNVDVLALPQQATTRQTPPTHLGRCRAKCTCGCRSRRGWSTGRQVQSSAWHGPSATQRRCPPLRRLPRRLQVAQRTATASSPLALPWLLLLPLDLRMRRTGLEVGRKERQNVAAYVGTGRREPEMQHVYALVRHRPAVALVQAQGASQRAAAAGCAAAATAAAGKQRCGTGRLLRSASFPHPLRPARAPLRPGGLPRRQCVRQRALCAVQSLSDESEGASKSSDGIKAPAKDECGAWRPLAPARLPLTQCP